MRRFLILSILCCLVLTGCQSKQKKAAQLQGEYNKAHKHYYDDCVAPAYGGAGADAYLKGTKPKTPTPEQEGVQQQKCAAEAKRAGDLQNQLQAASQ
jgi:hypothetical protein